MQKVCEDDRPVCALHVHSMLLLRVQDLLFECHKAALTQILNGMFITHPCSRALSLTHTCTRMHTHTHMHTNAHAHAHAQHVKYEIQTPSTAETVLLRQSEV